MKYTTNYNLKKPDQDDFYNIEDLNSNAEVIDTELKRIDEKANVTEQNAKAYTDQQITLVTETGIPKLNVYEYKFNNVAIGTTEIQIPLETFDKQTDTIKVYINTVPRDTDYFTVVDTTRDETGNLLENGKIVLNQSLEKESKVVIEVWKNIPMGEEGSVSGNVIAVDSIPQDRVQGLLDLKNNVVQKTGDTMTGGLTIDSSMWLRLRGTADRIIEFLDPNISPQRQGFVGRVIGSSPYVGINNSVAKKNLMIRDNGELMYNSDNIWHAGNMGHGSGLDADLLDGKHANEFWEKSNLPIATTAEAQVGTRNDRIMTPAGVKGAIDKLGTKLVLGSYVGNGNNTRSIDIGGDAILINVYGTLKTESLFRLTSTNGGTYEVNDGQITLFNIDLLTKTTRGFVINSISDFNVEGKIYYWEAWI